MEKPQHKRYLEGFRTQQCLLFLERKCSKRYSCFDWHYQTQRRRRSVRYENGTFNYCHDIYCKNYNKRYGVCHDRDGCPFLHKNQDDTEKRFHLLNYKTRECPFGTDGDGYCKVNGPHCADAHGHQDLRFTYGNRRLHEHRTIVERPIRARDQHQIDKGRIKKHFEKVFHYKTQRESTVRLKCIEKLAKTWEIDTFMNMKAELNGLKNILNDIDIISWHNHTKRVNPAGDIVNMVYKRIQPGMCTQAWCKFYEIASSFLKFDSLPSLYTLHLCELPGAFISSLNHYLHNRGYKGDWKWKATSLNPYYEYSNNLLECGSLLTTNYYNNWYFGEDDSGNVMSLVNLQGLRNIIGNSHVDLVTADGSINCESNPIEQENAVSQLQHCQVLTALHILSPGGTLVVKLFTMFECKSICLMYLLNCLFEKVSVFKPCTSKRGNSEVYAICQSFKERELCAEFLESVTNIYFGDADPDGCLFQQADIPESFLEQHSLCVEFFKNCQMSAIQHNHELYKAKSNKTNVSCNKGTFDYSDSHDKKQFTKSAAESMKGKDICINYLDPQIQQEKDYCVEYFFKKYGLQKILNSDRRINLSKTNWTSNEFKNCLKTNRLKGSLQHRQHHSFLPWQQKINTVTLSADINMVDGETNMKWIQCTFQPPTDVTIEDLKPIWRKSVNNVHTSRFCRRSYIAQIHEIIENVQLQSYRTNINTTLLQDTSEQLLKAIHSGLESLTQDEASHNKSQSDHKFACLEDHLEINCKADEQNQINNNVGNNSHGNNSKSYGQAENDRSYGQADDVNLCTNTIFGETELDEGVKNWKFFQFDTRNESQMCIKFIAKTSLTPALIILANKESLNEKAIETRSVLLYAVPDLLIDSQLDIKDHAPLCRIVLDILKDCPVDASVVIEMGPSLTRMTAGLIYMLYMCFNKIGFVHCHGNLLRHHLVCVSKNACPVIGKFQESLEKTSEKLLDSNILAVHEIVSILTLLKDNQFVEFITATNTNLLKSFINTIILNEKKHGDTIEPAHQHQDTNQPEIKILQDGSE